MVAYIMHASHTGRMAETPRSTSIRVPEDLRDQLAAIAGRRPLADALAQLIEEHETRRMQAQAAFADALEKGRMEHPEIHELSQKRADNAIELLRRMSAQ